MGRIAYVAGRYVPIGSPAVPVEDRAHQFGDAVYEVTKAVDGRLIDIDRHFARLGRSAAAIDLTLPMSLKALQTVIMETLRRNPMDKALVYLHVSRGVAPRNQLFPKATAPRLVVTVRRWVLARSDLAQGVAVVSRPDPRWQRCDIKATSLLANVLMRQSAAEAGAREAWLVDRDGFVTEGSTSNAWIVDAAGMLVTRALGPEILGGVTRAAVLDLARANGITVVERAFTVAEALASREAFLTSTSALVLPVTRVDGQVLGNGHPGLVTSRLLDLYARHCGVELAL